MTIYRFVFRIVSKVDILNIIDGEWATFLPASKICEFFEENGYNVVQLQRTYSSTSLKAQLYPSIYEKGEIKWQFMMNLG